MGDFTIGGPGRGDNWDKEGCLDHLLGFIGGFQRRQNTSNEGRTYETAFIEFVICLDHPDVWVDQNVSGAVLVPRLTNVDDEVVVARLGQGLSKPGKNAPWTLDDPTPADLDRAQAKLERYVSRSPAGNLIVDTKAIKADRPDEDPL